MHDFIGIFVHGLRGGAVAAVTVIVVLIISDLRKDRKDVG